MATRGKYYHLQFKQADRDGVNTIVQNDIHVRIYDLTLEGDDTISWEVVELMSSGDPLHTSTVDNSDDKFTGVKPTQATIKFISSSSVNVSTFVDAPINTAAGGIDVGDPRWYVEIYMGDYGNSKFIFKGFLNIDDCYEDFMPEKNEVVLVANDGLAGLKNIPLTDLNGNNPVKENSIADFLAWSLSKTGLELDLHAIFNIRERGNSTKHFFESIYLNSKTFEDQIGTCINCYDVIERILGEEAFLCQRGGKWWIVRVDELGNNRGYYKAIFNSQGVLQSIDDSSVLMAYGIAKELQDTFFSQEQTQVYPTRPFKHVKETYKFEYPLEIIDNIDFSRGDQISFDAGTLTSKSNIENWALLQGFDQTSADTTAYIHRKFADVNQTYENERYVVIEHTSGGGRYFLKSQRLWVGKNDKFDISVDSRFESDVFGTSGHYQFGTIQVRLTCNDGSHYILFGGISSNKTPKWLITSGSFTSNNEYIYIEGNLTENLTEWKTASWIFDGSDQYPCPPIPGDGFLEILLFWDQNSSFQTDRYFSNLRFTYIPYINGAYSKYGGYSYKVSRPVNLVNIREKQPYISDSQKALFKGGLFKKSSRLVVVGQFDATFAVDKFSVSGNYLGVFTRGQSIKITGSVNNNFNEARVTNVVYESGLTRVYLDQTITTETATITVQENTYELANEFYSWTDIHTTSPSAIYIHPYAHLQVFDVWNQYRDSLRKFQFTAQGLGWGQNDQYVDSIAYPSLVHTYSLLDNSEHTNDRYFMLLSFDIDWFLCEWKGTLIEVYNSNKGKVYDDNLEIKYEQ